MLRKCLFFMLLFIGIVHFSLGEGISHYKEIQSQKKEKASAVAKEKNFYITPRIGVSTLTGLIGIELQYKHFAFDIGYIKGTPPDEDVNHDLTYGIRYYFEPHRSTAYIGLGGWIDLVKIIDEDEGRTTIGFILGYRWRWGKGWDFNLGIGPAFSKGKGAFVPPMFDIALGYSF